MPAWATALTDFSAVTLPYMVDASVLQDQVHDKFTVVGAHTHTGDAGDGAAAITPTSIVMGGEALWKKGSNIASANPLVLPGDGNYHLVTGTTNFGSISPAKQAGSLLLLKFQSSLTISGLTLQTGGSWVVPAGAMLMLVSEGSGTWTEVTRWVGGTIPHGNLWLVPNAVDGLDPWTTVNFTPAGYPTGPYMTFSGTIFHFQFAVPTDWATLVSATLHTNTAGTPATTDVSASLAGVTPGQVKAFSVSSADVQGLALEYRA